MSNVTPSSFDTLAAAFQGITQSSQLSDLLTKFNAYLTSYATSQGIDISSLSDADLNALLVQYLKGQITSAYTSEASNALSLDEIAARQTIFAVYSLCIQMLQALQGSMKTQSTLLDIYTQWQYKYTQMTSQLPMYGPQAPNHILANNTDFGQTTLGYASLTVQQVFQSLMAEPQFSSGTPSNWDITAVWSPPEIGDPYFPTATSPIQFKLTQHPDGTFSAEVDIADNWTVAPPNSPVLFSTGPIALNPNLAGQAQQDDVISRLMQGLTTGWQSLSTDQTLMYIYPPNGLTPVPGTSVAVPLRKSTFATLWGPNHTDIYGTSCQTYDKYYVDSNNNKYIYPAQNSMAFWTYMFTTGVWGPEAQAWPETLGAYDDPNNPNPPDANTLASLRSQEYQYRSQVNSQLQLFLTTAKSKSDTVSSHAQQTQTVVSQIQQSIQAQADLLKSIVDTLTTLVSALFH